MPRFSATGDPLAGDRPGSVLAGLFGPLDQLLVSGGDPRLRINKASGVSDYGCKPHPCPDTLSFASCTATSISERAYLRVSKARDALMQSVIAAGLEAAFDARVETMRGELKAALGLSQAGVEVVFSASGTDAQLQALLLSRALLGPILTTIIVAADQTGSGTVDTARGRHFSAATSTGSRVPKGEPIPGLADGVTSVALPLLDQATGFRPCADGDARVIDAVEKSAANGARVLLQIMASSKLGWRAPSQRCLDEIAARWPGRVQVVVDACQMRIGRPRLRKYIERGYIVIVTGSKFFTGPAFSGALLVPAGLSNALDQFGDVPSGFAEYCSRSDWPMNWPCLRAHFPARANFGQWLRWEAALEEIRAYFRVPDDFRRAALTTFGEGVERLIAASPWLRLLPPGQQSDDHGGLDQELAQPTIFPLMIRQGERIFSSGECRKIYRALARIPGTDGSARGHPAAMQACLVGQPVVLGELERQPVAALRLCAGARLVTEAWGSKQDTVLEAIRHELDRVGAVVSKLEWLVAHRDGRNFAEACHEA